jgi:hypothetical protein
MHYALIQQLLPLLIEAQGQLVFINSTQGPKATLGSANSQQPSTP